VTVTDNKAQSRYEMEVDGRLAIAVYRLEGANLSIIHVEVPPELRGGGIAAQLMAGVVADAKARSLKIIPVCPYAASYLKKNPV
jgi:predicted GNAT family acetyltransferase